MSAKRKESLSQQLKRESKSITGETRKSSRGWISRWTPSFLNNIGTRFKGAYNAFTGYECEDAAPLVNDIQKLIKKLQEVAWVIRVLEPLHGNELFGPVLVELHQRLLKYSDIVNEKNQAAKDLGEQGCVTLQTVNTIRSISQTVDVLWETFVEGLQNTLLSSMDRYYDEATTAAGRARSLRVYTKETSQEPEIKKAPKTKIAQAAYQTTATGLPKAKPQVNPFEDEDATNLSALNRTQSIVAFGPPRPTKRRPLVNPFDAEDNESNESGPNF
jgi:hypothetical protein